MVKYARSNFMTPIPAAARVDDLPGWTSDAGHGRAERAGRHAGTIGERQSRTRTVQTVFLSTNSSTPKS